MELPQFCAEASLPSTNVCARWIFLIIDSIKTIYDEVDQAGLLQKI